MMPHSSSRRLTLLLTTLIAAGLSGCASRETATVAYAGVSGRHLSIKDTPEATAPRRPVHRASYQRPAAVEPPAAAASESKAPAAKSSLPQAQNTNQLPAPDAAPFAKSGPEAARAPEKPADKPAAAAKSATTSPSAPPLVETRRGASPGVVVPPLPKQDVDSVAAQIEQSEMLLRIGDVKGARDAVDRGVKAGNPDAIVALARTYDPLELTTLLVPPGVDDVPAAVKLYAEAAAKGSRVAKTKLDRLLAATASEPSQPKKK